MVVKTTSPVERVFRLHGCAADDYSRAAWAAVDVFHKTEPTQQYARCIVEQYLQEGHWIPVVERDPCVAQRPLEKPVVRVGLRFYDYLYELEPTPRKQATKKTLCRAIKSEVRKILANDDAAPELCWWIASECEGGGPECTTSSWVSQIWLDQNFARGRLVPVDPSTQAEYDAADARVPNTAQIEEPVVQLRVGLRFFENRPSERWSTGTLWVLDRHDPSMPLSWSMRMHNDREARRACRQDYLLAQFANGTFVPADAATQAAGDAADERERVERAARRDDQELEGYRMSMKALRDCLCELFPADTGGFIESAIYHLRAAANWQERAEVETARANKLADEAGDLEARLRGCHIGLGEQAERILALERKLARK
jgi:hypothetical protein